MNAANHRSNGTTEISLQNGLVTIIDSVDYHLVKDIHWYGYKAKTANTYYAASHGPPPKRTLIFMHSLILPGVKPIDHRSGNGLDNRRQNLRPATHSENCFNIKKKGRTRDRQPTSKYAGVKLQRNSWIATITKDRKSIYLGSYPTEEQAYLARLAAENKYYPNFKREWIS